VWAAANKGQNMVLWCDGLKSDGTIQTSAGKKRKASDSGATQSKKADTADQVQQCVENLKKQHGENYTPMQYRVWGEMIHGGIRKSATLLIPCLSVVAVSQVRKDHQ